MLTFRFIALTCLFSVGLGQIRPLNAEIILETASGWDEESGVGNIKPLNVWGQSFVAPPDSDEITRASIWVQSYPYDNPAVGPYNFGMKAYLMAWDGLKGIQPILTDTQTAVTAMPWEMTRVDFDFFNANVQDGQSYVVFFQLLLNPDVDYLTFGINSTDVYSDGKFGGSYAGSIYTLSTRAWSMFNRDIAFELHFTPVPELSAFWFGLIIIAMLVVTIVLRKQFVMRRKLYETNLNQST